MNSVLPPKNEIRSILASLAYGTATEENAGVLDVGTQDYLNYFERELFSEYIEQGGATCRFFEGMSGSGKTHTLRLIERMALQSGYIVCYIELRQNQNLTEWDQVVRHILEKMKVLINGKEIKKFPEILAALEGASWITPWKLDEVSLEHPSIKKAITYALRRSDLKAEEWECIRQYLMGERKTVAEFKKHGLKGIKKSITKNNAEQSLNTILNAIHYLGMKGVILLFDETDRTFTSQRDPIPKKVQMAANIIRRFIDACSAGQIKGTCAIFAVQPNFIRQCAACYPALGQRLNFNMDDLGILAWRWSLLGTNSVNVLLNAVDDPSMKKQVFFHEMIKKFAGLVEYCDGDMENIESFFEQEGANELVKNAGDEYKRAVIKVLADCSLIRIERADTS
jgi:hypothetical protein